MKIIAVLTLASTIILGWLLSSANPTTISPAGILVVFLLLYTSILGVLTYILYAGSFITVRILHAVTKRRVTVLSLKNSYLFASVLAIAPVILVAMQSVEAMGLSDIALVLLFELLACFYVWRRT
jgi:hypothetical protein